MVRIQPDETMSVAQSARAQRDGGFEVPPTMGLSLSILAIEFLMIVARSKERRVVRGISNNKQII